LLRALNYNGFGSCLDPIFLQEKTAPMTGAFTRSDYAQ